MKHTLSANGINLLKAFEGSRAVAYRDSAQRWTIGVGHLIKPDEQELLTATLTPDEIDRLLRADVAWAERAVNDGLRVNVTQNQFDALVSFAFNVGAQAFTDSTLLKRINAQSERAAITEQFMRWTKAGGQDVAGLKNRRRIEARHYWQHLGTLAVLFFIAGAVLFTGAAITLLA